MVRRTVGKSANKAVEEKYDFRQMIDKGITLLKFGRSGKPHERLFKLSGDMRFLHWYSGWFTGKIGSRSDSKFIIIYCKRCI